MSGGGRCNFTNYYVTPENFISHNPHFCKSALSRYTPYDFIKLVEQHQIPYHEKTLGQLFCDNKSKDILTMLITECDKAHVTIKLNTSIEKISPQDNQRFTITASGEKISCQSLVVATGGLSIPTLGASPFGYKIAKQFGLKVWPTTAGLVPFTLHSKDKEHFAPLTGISVDCTANNKRINFRENLLFTHRGLSGPAILQISSYWQPGESVNIDLLPDTDLLATLKTAQIQQPKISLKSFLASLLPKRVIHSFLGPLEEKTLANLSFKDFETICQILQNWQLKPNATEGYRTAEVTLGGVDCNALSSKTMQVNHIPGLYFIGEVVDVTGWLGGFNFQWAWASGFAAGQVA